MNPINTITPPAERTKYWQTYVDKRYRAHLNLMKILRNQGFEQGLESGMVFANVDEYARWAGERIDPVRRIGIFERDKKPLDIQLGENQDSRMLIFFMSSGNKDTISKKIINETVGSYLELVKEGDKYLSAVEYIPNKQIILVSQAPLDGTGKNQLIYFNSILEYPIRHFTLDELQYDPTEHALCPKNIRKATPAEIRILIDRQRNLHIGPRKKLVSESDPDKIDEEILDKLPTINSGDPIVKRYGFILGDVLVIEREFGRTEFTYRRVVSADRVQKSAKLDQQDITNN